MKAILICFFSLLIAANLTGQIVDIEAKRSNISDTSGLFGYVDLSFNLIKNTRTITTIKGAVRLEWLKGRHRLLSLSNYNLTSVNDDRFINNAFQHLRYNYELNRWLSWEAFAQVQENEQIRIQFRGLLGTGPRFQVADSPKQKIYIGMLYMFEYNEVADTAFIQRDHRLSAYLSFFTSPNNLFSFSSTSYVQPEIIDPSDIRLTSSNTLQFKITDQLAYRASFVISYDSQLAKEAQGVPSTNYKFLNGLRWVF
ncbi:MAG: DUF481 domain-containing protein [Bacteroidota bacterium]